MNADDDALVASFGERGFIGVPASIHDRLGALASECDADEIMLMTGIHDHAARKRSYELLARAFS